MNTLVMTITKGGPGSGHRGHSGRPGKVGGSLPGGGGAYGGIANQNVLTELKTFEAKHSDITAVYMVEEVMVVSKDGRVMTQVTGDLSSVDVPPANYKDAILTHNHPPTTMKKVSGGRYYTQKFDEKKGWSHPFSPSDMVFAVTNDLQEVRVTGFEQGKSVMYRMIRPDGGWPLDIIAYHSNTITNDIMRGSVGSPSKTLAGKSSWMLDRHWRDVTDHFGIEYIKTEL